MTVKWPQYWNSAKVTPKDTTTSGILRLTSRNSWWVREDDSQAQEFWGHCQPHAEPIWHHPWHPLQTWPYKGGEDTGKLFANVLQSHLSLVSIVHCGLFCLSWEAFTCAGNKRSKEAPLVVGVPWSYTGWILSIWGQSGSGTYMEICSAGSW